MLIIGRSKVVLIVLLIGVAAADIGCGNSHSPGKQPPLSTPKITSLTPSTSVAGGAAFTLTIDGADFVAASIVNFRGSAATTTFINSNELTAAIPASSVATAGILAVTVTNPGPGGATSNSLAFTVTNGLNPVPSISSFYPSCAPAGEQLVDSTDDQLVVSGQDFGASSVVRWNGTDLPTTLDGNSGNSSLTAHVPASDIAAAGTAAVTVFNSPPGGGTSNSMTFTATPGGVDPLSITVDPTGKFAYVANAGCIGGVAGYVSMYTINATTGALATVAPPASSLDSGGQFVTVDPSGKFAYVANVGDDFESDGSLESYTINATTGALTASGSILGNCPGLCVPVWMAVDPTGKFVYVANGDGLIPNNVAAYNIVNATTGALVPKGAFTVGGYASSVAVDPTGKFLYVTIEASASGSADSVSMFTINTTTGALTPIGTIAAGSGPASMTVDPTGKFAYVTNSASNDVSMYTVNPTTGALASVGTIAAGTDPVSVAVDPSGKFAYVTNFSSNDVAMYTINATTGALTSIGTVAAGLSPNSIAVHPSGKFAYVANSASNDVSIYSIDAATGVLTLIGTIGT